MKVGKSAITPKQTAGNCRRFCLTALVTLMSGPSVAADEDIYFSNLPVVATVSRLPQALADAPGSVTVIDREMIKASGVRDLNDIFRLVPGFNTYPFNSDAAPRVTYHGITDEEFSPRVQVLVDGRSQYSPLFRSGVNWAIMPVALEDIERIEVVRGSNSASYGSNAFLGVINIITVDSSQVKGVSVSASHGNQGVRDYTLRTGGRFGTLGNFRFTYQQRDDQGLTDQWDWKDGFRARLFDFRADLTLTERDQLTINAGQALGVNLNGTGRKAIVGNVVQSYEDPCSPFFSISQSNTFLQLMWQRALSPDSDLQVRYAHIEDWGSGNHVERCGNTSFNGNSDLLYRVDLYGDKGTRDELEIQHTFSPWQAVRLVWGFGSSWEATRSETMFHGNPTIRRQVSRIFGNVEWKAAERVTLNAGATAEHDTLAGPTFSPRLSASYHLTPENTVRLGWSRAHRTPSAIDLRGDRWKSPFSTAAGTPIPADELYVRRFYADGSIEPERIDSYELAYLGDWKSLRMSLDVRLYHEIIPNRLLSLRRRLTDPALCEISSGPPFVCTGGATAEYTTNAQHVETEGIEYQWRWQPWEGTRLLFNQAFTHIYSHYLETLDTSESAQRLENIQLLTQMSAPRRSATAMLMQKLPLGLEFSATHYWVGAMKWTQNSMVLPYKRLDLRLAYPFRIGSTGGELAYVLQSANGEHGEFKFDPDGAVGPAGRIVSERQWLTLRLDF